MHGDLSRKDKFIAFFSGIFVGLVVLGVALYQVPAVQDRVGWRVDFAMVFVRGLIDPVRPMPTPIVATEVAAVNAGGPQETSLPVEPTRTPTLTPTQTATVVGTPVPTETLAPTETPTAIPAQAELPPPKYEKQDLNNCGPTTLALNLRFYGWQGDQTTIASVIKPKKEDRNVNVEELVSYVNTKVPGIEIQYRVGGDIDMLKRLIAAGYPVTIEEAFIMAESYWPNDDRWAGHYLLLTGYDDAKQMFTTQDVFVGPNFKVAYTTLDHNWKAFNRVYIIVYPPDDRSKIQAILGDQWDAEANRQHAVDLAQQETDKDSTDSYAWFNLGTNLVYFEKYAQAAQAYDKARDAGLPQRMLRYQFGPFFAYFHTNRIDDLIALADYALKRTPTSEEAMLWKGWAMYRKGDREAAVKLFQDALDARPDYPDALYALTFMQTH